MQSTPFPHPSVFAPSDYTQMPAAALNGYSSSNLSDSLSPGRRQRISMACQYCRRRKIRCGGGKCCVNCEKSGKTCTYEAVPDEVNKATRQKKAASKAARVPYHPVNNYVPYPPPVYPMAYDHHLTVPQPQHGSRMGLSHRRTSSAPLFGINHSQQQGYASSPNMYDAAPQGQGWQYPVGQYMPPAEYNGPATQPMTNYSTMQDLYPPSSSSSFDNTHQMPSSTSFSDGINTMPTSVSFPDLSQMASSSSGNEFNDMYMCTPQHGHQSLSIDSTSTLSSGPTVSSPNTPAVWYGTEVMPQTFAPLTYGEQSEHLPTEYKGPKDGLVGLGISQQPLPTPTRLQPSIDPLNSGHYFGYQQ